MKNQTVPSDSGAGQKSGRGLRESVLFGLDKAWLIGQRERTAVVGVPAAWAGTDGVCGEEGCILRLAHEGERVFAFCRHAKNDDFTA